MAYKNILLEADGPLTYLVLNRPDKFNALSKQTILEMTEALTELKDKPDCRAIIIRAEGRHFCSGHDLSEMTGQDTADYNEIFENCCRMMELIHRVPQPVIAQVHGVATAAGCQLAASCDLVVAEEKAQFGTPGVRIGLFCSTPMVPLVRAVGRKRALEMLLTGRLVPAEEAAQWGLVNRVVPAEDLAAQVKELATTIIQASPFTLALGKDTFYQQVDLPESAAYGVAKNAIVMNLTTLDAQEGITAFLEKRKPDWQGK